MRDRHLIDLGYIDGMGAALVTGSTGFVGKALLPALVAAGHEIRATTPDLARGAKTPHVEWVRCDVNDSADVARALEGIDAAYFLVHSTGGFLSTLEESFVQRLGPKIDNAER